MRNNGLRKYMRTLHKKAEIYLSYGKKKFSQEGLHKKRDKCGVNDEHALVKVLTCMQGSARLFTRPGHSSV